jgi:hypothetical protein
VAARKQALVSQPKGLGKKFPEIVEARASLDLQDAIIDGEIVALDDQGRSSFGMSRLASILVPRIGIQIANWDLADASI